MSDNSIYKYEQNRFVRFAYRFRYIKWTYISQSLKFIALFYFSIMLIVLFIFQVIQIYVFFGSQNSNFLWTILNALCWQVYLNALGIFNFGIRKRTYKYLILGLAIFLMLIGFGYFEIVINIHLPFLVYQTFSTSSSHGIYFFWLNIYLWIPIFALTFLIESETTTI